MPQPWAVLKFGGTSVASAARWRTIAGVARDRLAGRRVLLVCSALSGVTNLLERAVAAARAGEVPATLDEVIAQHEALAREAGLEGAAAAVPGLADLWEETARLLHGARLTGEASPRLTARVLAAGELASTRLGAVLLAREGLAPRWIDARTLLDAHDVPLGGDARRYLAAAVTPQRAPERLDAAAEGAALALTQGFIARAADGATCLLGRGGSDTSAALLAALAGAASLEIWTDVAGLFTADPREVPSARLIRAIGYREARELASLGAKVLHPPCLEPVRRFGIPTLVKSTLDPALPGTLIEAVRDDAPAVTAVTCRRGATLLTIATVAMWDTPGFLARLFAPFEELGISVDLVGTSETAVSVTLDRLPGGLAGDPFERLVARLRELGEVEVVHPCAVVSIVGRRIRAALPEIGAAFSVFAERPVHLISNSSEDLNVSFVVDEDEGTPLVRRLHDRLLAGRGDDPRFGPSWEELRGAPAAGAPALEPAWWVAAREDLLALVDDGAARYVYHLPTVRERAARLRAALPAVARLFYSMKANPHADVLRALTGAGFGLECVSADEVAAARAVTGAATPLLFTPNFCPPAEYAVAYAAGAEVTVDGPHLFEEWPALFAGREVALRIDPGWGAGHHDKVRTGGARSKFGHPAAEAAALVAAARAAGARVTGLHAHLGSGILDAAAWAAAGKVLAAIAAEVGEGLRWIDLGGGLGVPERPGRPGLDLAALAEGLAPLAAALAPVELRLEPGRWLVAEAGVLLAPVTQVRRKGDVLLVGVATGMNSLIRPALYGAWHPIVNLTRLGAAPDTFAQVVGPICESGDVLGRDRWLAAPRPGDVLLVAHAGAYGAAMASRYNLRAPAAEVVLP